MYSCIFITEYQCLIQSINQCQIFFYEHNMYKAKHLWNRSSSNTKKVRLVQYVSLVLYDFIQKWKYGLIGPKTKVIDILSNIQHKDKDNNKTWE